MLLWQSFYMSLLAVLSHSKLSPRCVLCTIPSLQIVQPPLSQKTENFRAPSTFTSIPINMCIISVVTLTYFPPLFWCLLSPLPVRLSSLVSTSSSHRETYLPRYLSAPVYAVLWEQVIQVCPKVPQ